MYKKSIIGCKTFNLNSDYCFAILFIFIMTITDLFNHLQNKGLVTALSSYICLRGSGNTYIKSKSDSVVYFVLYIVFVNTRDITIDPF